MRVQREARVLTSVLTESPTARYCLAAARATLCSALTGRPKGLHLGCLWQPAGYPVLVLISQFRSKFGFKVGQGDHFLIVGETRYLTPPCPPPRGGVR